MQSARRFIQNACGLMILSARGFIQNTRGLMRDGRLRIGLLLQQANADLRPSCAKTKNIAGANGGAGRGWMAIHEGFAAQRSSSGQADRSVDHLKC